MALADKTWTQIAGGSGFGSAFQNGQTLTGCWTPMSGSPSGSGAGQCNQWTGAVMDEDNRRLVMCANGGHGDYWGNEVLALELQVDVPYWRQLADASPTSYYATNPPNNSSSITNADDLYGRCASMHTANTQAYLDGYVWTMMQSAYANVGGESSAIYSYNLRNAALIAANGPANAPIGSLPVAMNAGPWQYRGNFTGTLPSGFAIAAADKVGHKIWGIGTGMGDNNSIIWNVDTVSGAIATYADSITTNNLQSGCGAVAHDLRVLFVMAQNGQLYSLDLTNPSAVLTAVTVASGWVVDTANPYSSSQADHLGMEYCRASHSLLLYDVAQSYCASGVIVKITIPINANGSWNPSGTYAVTYVSPAGAGPYPTIPSQFVGTGWNGTYGKFRLLQNRGDGSGLIVMPLGPSAGQTWVYKIPVGGL
jgi:hypothetical protein